MRSSRVLWMRSSRVLWMRSSQVLWMRSSRVLRMRSSRVLWMRSSLMVRASGCQCQSRNSPGLDPIASSSPLTQWNLRAADEAVLNNAHKKPHPKRKS
jgi:hypothetical protein